MGRKAKNEGAELQPVLQLKQAAKVGPEPVQLEILLGIPEVMAVLGLSRPMVYKLIREEGLPTVPFGDRRKVVPSLLAAWVKQRVRSGM